MKYYSIREDTITDIADAIRSKTGSTETISANEMAEKIEGIIGTVEAPELPDAEDAIFGTENVVYEPGCTASGGTPTALTTNAKPNYVYLGYQFGVRERLCVYAFRYCRKAVSTFVMSLYDETNGIELATQTVSYPGSSSSPYPWLEIELPAPVELIPGNTYIVYAYATNGTSAYYYNSGSWSFGAKLSNASIVHGSSAPPTVVGDTCLPLVDIVLGPVLGDSRASEYAIQTTTMDEIADEVKRLSGTSGKMTTAQIIAALQSVPVQTTE